ncbi:hypothetical protein BD626DRAFT_541395 [Schizophyllum amplum]|uniref:Uncharacterized protein n=1 Tax=Schizophyllum amplum TaxID=97359 RepID=A0A550BUV6_9AGAR|nr:hypothetical protein BD626DRAFT_541395 [Auriculariopsis ampla]
MSSSTESVDHAFQLIRLEDVVDALVDSGANSRASSPTTTEPDDDVAQMDGVATADTTDNVALANVAPDATMNGIDADPAAAAAAAAAVGAFPFVCMNPMEHRAGIALGVVPLHELVAGTVATDSSKYYAIARGRFIGVFDDSSMYVLATGKVSNPISWCPSTLGNALQWFNAKRDMGVCEIIN